MRSSRAEPFSADVISLVAADQERLAVLLGALGPAPSGWSWGPSDAPALLQHWRVIGLTSASGKLLAFVASRFSGDVLEIGALATLPEARGQGLMVRLLESLKAELWFKGQEIWLEVSANNIPAQRTYGARGFRVVGTRANYYRDGSSAYLMTFVSESAV